MARRRSLVAVPKVVPDHWCIYWRARLRLLAEDPMLAAISVGAAKAMIPEMASHSRDRARNRRRADPSTRRSHVALLPGSARRAWRRGQHPRKQVRRTCRCCGHIPGPRRSGSRAAASTLIAAASPDLRAGPCGLDEMLRHLADQRHRWRRPPSPLVSSANIRPNSCGTVEHLREQRSLALASSQPSR